jgi:hypothetical protein
VGLGPCVRGWSAAVSGDEEARWFAPRVTVRLLCTLRPAHQLYDFVGPGPRARGLAVGFGRDEEAHYRGRRFAPCVTVCLLRTRRPAPRLNDLWARAPVS